MPCITTQGTGGSVLLQPGLYNFVVVGKRIGNAPFVISISTMTPPAAIRYQLVRAIEFEFTAVRMLTQETELNVSIQRNDTVLNLNVEATLVIERL